ncbi:MAG: tetratricopeptide repeat protein [Planctomycetota bacterium]
MEAEQGLAQVQRLRGDTARARLELAELEQRVALAEGKDLAANHFLVQIELALCALQEGRLEAAVERLQALLEAAPVDIPTGFRMVLCSLTDALWLSRRGREAEAACLALLEQNDTKAASRAGFVEHSEFSWAIARMSGLKTATYEAALASARLAVVSSQEWTACEPTEADLQLAVGAAQYRLGHLDTALTTLESVIARRSEQGQPPTAPDLAFLAMTLHELGDHEAALETLDELQMAVDAIGPLDTFRNTPIDETWRGSARAQAERLLEEVEALVTDEPAGFTANRTDPS